MRAIFAMFCPRTPKPRACSSSKSSRLAATGRAIRRTSTIATRCLTNPISRRPIITGSKPPQGFAFQRVYTDDRSLDETLTVKDGDVVLVPRGYHPVGAPHGYDLYYLNVMAGPKRVWRFHNDPAHEWLMK